MYFANFDDDIGKGLSLDEAFADLIASSEQAISVENAIFYEAEEIEVQLARKPTITRTTSKE